ncbi:MAG: hypothetical protein K2N48_10910 [Muribaculaceae bacterium]|nr:hypothetical protein [Muribaculaceae bacterium]
MGNKRLGSDLSFSRELRTSRWGAEKIFLSQLWEGIASAMKKNLWKSVGSALRIRSAPKPLKFGSVGHKRLGSDLSFQESSELADGAQKKIF